MALNCSPAIASILQRLLDRNNNCCSPHVLIPCNKADSFLKSEFKKRLQVCRAHETSTRGCSITVMKSRQSASTKQSGSLVDIFSYYAKLLHPNLQAGKGPVPTTFASIERANMSMSLDEFSFMCKDFGLMPNYIRQKDLSLIFARANVLNGDDDTWNRELEFDEFTHVLAAVANIVFSCAEFRDHFPHTIGKLQALAIWMRLKHHRLVKSFLEELAELRKRKSSNSIPLVIDQFLWKSAGPYVLNKDECKDITLSQVDETLFWTQFISYPKTEWDVLSGRVLDIGQVRMRDMTSDHKFKLVVVNKTKQSVYIDFCCAELPFLQVRYGSSQIPAGLNQVAVIHFAPDFSECGEYVGYLFIEIQRHHHLLERISVPVYISITS